MKRIWKEVAICYRGSYEHFWKWKVSAIFALSEGISRLAARALDLVERNLLPRKTFGVPVISGSQRGMCYQGSQAMGSGPAVSVEESGMRLYHFCGISDQNLSRFWNQGSGIFAQKWDQR